MSLLCDLKTFKSALEECVFLLTKENLSPRGTEDVLSNSDLENLRNFLSWMVTKINGGINSYEKLVEEIQRSETPASYKLQIGFLGKILDAVQIVKPSTLRNLGVIATIKEALNRTGHEFVWEEANKEERERYAKELVRATATFHLLEIVFSKTKTAGKKNPIATLRRSMGDRLPEEYFAELLAGWFVEDIIKLELERKGFTAELKGVDRERKVFLVRPSNMGDYDLEVKMGNESYLLEVQRIGKLTKNRESLFKTALKSHKYEGGNSNDKILILWIGENPTQIAKAHSKWFNHLIFIPNIKHQRGVTFSNDTIYFKESLLINGSLSWGKFKDINGGDLIEIFKKLAVST